MLFTKPPFVGDSWEPLYSFAWTWNPVISLIFMILGYRLLKNKNFQPKKDKLVQVNFDYEKCVGKPKTFVFMDETKRSLERLKNLLVWPRLGNFRIF